MLTLADARKSKGVEVDQSGFKNWFTKNKSIVYIGGAALILVAGYIGYKAVFKKKGSTMETGGGVEDLGTENIPQVDFG